MSIMFFILFNEPIQIYKTFDLMNIFVFRPIVSPRSNIWLEIVDFLLFIIFAVGY